MKNLTIIQILDKLTAKFAKLEKEINEILTPIRGKITNEIERCLFNAKVFGKGWFTWEAAVGYNGANDYQRGKRWAFSFDRNSKKLQFGDWESGIIETADDFEFWFGVLAEKVVKKVYYYYEGTDNVARKRLLETLRPLEYFKQYGTETA